MQLIASRMITLSRKIVPLVYFIDKSQKNKSSYQNHPCYTNLGKKHMMGNILLRESSGFWSWPFSHACQGRSFRGYARRSPSGVNASPHCAKVPASGVGLFRLPAKGVPHLFLPTSPYGTRPHGHVARHLCQEVKLPRFREPHESFCCFLEFLPKCQKIVLSPQRLPERVRS